MKLFSRNNNTRSQSFRVMLDEISKTNARSGLLKAERACAEAGRENKLDVKLRIGPCRCE